MSEPMTTVRAVCGVAAVNERGQVLLLRRSDDSSWCLPGGGVEPGETWANAGMRECMEETGWSVRLTGLLGVYSDPSTQSHVYPGGQSVHLVGVAFIGEVIDREQDPGGESSEVAFFDLDELPEPLFPPDRPVLEDFARRTLGPFLR